ncbi:MAG: VWA domain-containing protein [Acidobacteriia bacterium]|nr:VWA domain-containing protein [Terriglobia bacterium]MBV8902247.1 VWA domain-containing protein [Terriglobia bacterium]MBV9743816.1 VWA domain-containing protein [Terriglobia bacterium]
MIRIAVVSFLPATWLVFPALSQAQSAPQPVEAGDKIQANIQVNVNEVIVPVTVTDQKGRFVSNLTARDFRVLDEGKPQRIEFFSHDQKQPVVIGFLLELSNNTRIHWKRLQDSVMEMVWNLLPNDKKYEGYLITYSNDAELAVNTTWDGDKITDEIRKEKPGGGAALFDAIYMACTKRELVKGEPYEPRRVIIIVGDGHDSSSKKSLDEVIELAQRNLVTIYAMSTSAYGFDNPDQAVLERLAGETGGKVEYPLQNIYKDTVAGTYFCNPSDEGCYSYTVGTGGYEAAISKSIINAVGSISGDVSTQYVLRYIPAIDPDDKVRQYRRIRVEVNIPDVIIRARKGYYPSAITGANAQDLQTR